MASKPNKIALGLSWVVRDVFLFFCTMIPSFLFRNWLPGPIWCFSSSFFTQYLCPPLCMFWVSLVFWIASWWPYSGIFPQCWLQTLCWKVLWAARSQPAGCIWQAAWSHHLYPLRQWLSHLFWLWPKVGNKVYIMTQNTYNFNSTYVNI